MSSSTTTLNRDYSPAHSDNSDSTIYLTTYKTSLPHKTTNTTYFNDEPQKRHHHHHQHHSHNNYEKQQYNQIQAKNQLNQTAPVVLKSNLKNYNSQQPHQQIQPNQQPPLQQKLQKTTLLNTDDYLINNFRPFSGQSQQQRTANVIQNQIRSSNYVPHKPNNNPVNSNETKSFVPNTFLTTTSWKLNEYNNHGSQSINNIETSKSSNHSKYQLMNSTQNLLRLELNDDNNNNHEDTIIDNSIISYATNNNNNNRMIMNPDSYSHSVVLSSCDHNSSFNSNSINNMIYSNNNISSSKFIFNIFSFKILLAASETSIIFTL
jgi:hypothetical protein